jgi:hypothetical protein
MGASPWDMAAAVVERPPGLDSGNHNDTNKALALDNPSQKLSLASKRLRPAETEEMCDHQRAQQHGGLF